MILKCPSNERSREIRNLQKRIATLTIYINLACTLSNTVIFIITFFCHWYKDIYLQTRQLSLDCLLVLGNLRVTTSFKLPNQANWNKEIKAPPLKSLGLHFSVFQDRFKRGGLNKMFKNNGQAYFLNIIYGTERSPEGRFSCRGILDFDEDCMFDIMLH